MKIHKETLTYGSTFINCSKVLKVGWQRNELCVWFEVGLDTHEVIAIWTGDEFDLEEGYEYLNTAISDDLVFHAFVRKE